MVAVATCSFYEFRPEMGLPVRITIGGARYFRQPLAATLTELAPERWFMGMEHGAFEEKMRSKLDTIGHQTVLARLQKIADDSGNPGATVVLLCFEQKTSPTGKKTVWPENWCHRTMVADWLTEKAGISVPELGTVDDPRRPPQPVAEEPAAQAGLF